MPVAPLVTAWRRTHRNLPGPTMGREALSNTFPATSLAIKVRIALGADLSADPLTWAWEDISAYVRFDLGISLEVGRRENSGSVTAGRAMLKLDNRDGRFTRRNPTGPYYGLLSKNTPIWVTVDAGSGEKTRIEMFVNEWPTRWTDKSATDCTVTIRCAGVLRRLAQGRVAKSALRRRILSDGPAEYWPLEDGTDAGIAASALPGGPSLNIVGTVDFATAGGPPGSRSLPASMLALSGELNVVARATTSTSWGVSLVIEFPPDNYPTDAVLGAVASWTVPGHSLFTRFRLATFFGESAGFQLDGFDSAGTGSTILGSPYPVTRDTFHHLLIWSEQSGSNIVSTLYYDGVATNTDTRAGTNGTTGIGRFTISPVLDELGQSIYAAADVSAGHFALYDDGITDTPANVAASQAVAMLGYAGAMAHERLARTAAEEGIVYESVASVSPTMGARSTAALIDVLHEDEAAGGGVLYEKRWGLAYQSLAERYNAPVALALDIDAGHVAELPEPADDDQRTRNKWTVSRPDGSEYTAEQTTGAMGAGTEGPGIYDDAAEVITETDVQLAHQAMWRTHLGIIDEDRWPVLDLNLTRNYALIDTWTALPFGARVTVANPLAQTPPDPPDLVIEGYAERFDSKLWTARLNASPSSAYRVFVVESSSGNLGRIDAGSSTLAADATSAATTISVASPSGVWTTGAVNFDIGVSGEQMTVTNISGATSPQTFTVTRAVNGVTKAQPSTVGGRAVKVSLWKPAVVAL